MQNLKHIPSLTTTAMAKTTLAIALLIISNQLMAEDSLVYKIDNKTQQLDNDLNRELERQLPTINEEGVTAGQLPTELPSEKKPQKKLSEEESLAYLKQHPEQMEQLLLLHLRQANSEALKALLPTYKEYKNHDPSVIDWGNAIILAKSGKLNQAITTFRKINAVLPDVQILRFQMAMALFYNGQYDAAKEEFEKLRTNTTNAQDLKAINNYLEAISRQNKWDFSASLSFVHDKNITNAPKEGTTFKRADGSTLIYNNPRQEGKGFNYSVSADKKWLYDNKSFTALHLDNYGTYYWNNRNYNDITAGVGLGMGYQTAITELEFTPFFNNRWYGGGRGSNGTLGKYSDTIGMKANLNQWLGLKWRFQGFASYSKTKYIESQKHNNSTDKFYAANLVYLPNPRQFWTLGVNYSDKSAVAKRDSYERQGFNLGWGQSWGKGFSTRARIGVAKRDYKAEDFFGNERHNTEYNTGITVWNRGISVFGLTPRLSFDHRSVRSNTPLEEYSKNNVSVELTKTF